MGFKRSNGLIRTYLDTAGATPRAKQLLDAYPASKIVKMYKAERAALEAKIPRSIQLSNGISRVGVQQAMGTAYGVIAGLEVMKKLLPALDVVTVGKLVNTRDPWALASLNGSQPLTVTEYAEAMIQQIDHWSEYLSTTTQGPFRFESGYFSNASAGSRERLINSACENATHQAHVALSGVKQNMMDYRAPSARTRSSAEELVQINATSISRVLAQFSDYLQPATYGAATVIASTPEATQMSKLAYDRRTDLAFVSLEDAFGRVFEAIAKLQSKQPIQGLEIDAFEPKWDRPLNWQIDTADRALRILDQNLRPEVAAPSELGLN